MASIGEGFLILIDFREFLAELLWMLSSLFKPNSRWLIFDQTIYANFKKQTDFINLTGSMTKSYVKFLNSYCLNLCVNYHNQWGSTHIIRSS